MCPLSANRTTLHHALPPCDFVSLSTTPKARRGRNRFDRPFYRAVGAGRGFWMEGIARGLESRGAALIVSVSSIKHARDACGCVPFGTIQTRSGLPAFSAVTAAFGHTPMQPVLMTRTCCGLAYVRSPDRNADFSVSLPLGPKPPPSFFEHLPQASKTVFHLVGRYRSSSATISSLSQRLPASACNFYSSIIAAVDVAPL
jgi:hypothetical protein